MNIKETFKKAFKNMIVEAPPRMSLSQSIQSMETAVEISKDFLSLDRFESLQKICNDTVTHFHVMSTAYDLNMRGLFDIHAKLLMRNAKRFIEACEQSFPKE